MRYINKIKNLIIDLTGYWIYQKKSLPIGMNLFFDLNNRFANTNVKTIFDVGGNIGQSIKRFKKEFPNSAIYSFEPVESTFLELKKCESLFNNVICTNKGLGSQKCQLPIYIEKHSTWNSLITNDDAYNTPTEMVQIETIDNFLSENKIAHIDILKIDTEGFDLEVLKGAEITLTEKNISFIYSETGLYPDDVRHTYLTDLINYLADYGYYFYSLYDMHGEGGNSSYANVLFTTKKGKQIANNI